MSATPIFQVDAFTTQPFRGTPAAVCLLSAPAEEGWMQAVAAEMNVAETAFLHPHEEGYRLRWFTPIVEVKLCGHATLASAHILWETGAVAGDSAARFHTASGLLTATRSGDEIVLDFPAMPAVPIPTDPQLAAALGVAPRFVGRSAFDDLVEVESEAQVRGLQPDLTKLAKTNARGVMVTSIAAADEYDFVSRFFAPAAGIDEDPVTGSAHCCLGPYWGERLGKTELLGYQASPRGGMVRVTLDGDRVRLGGHAVTVLRGTLMV
jgi:PhzF family phenazine biosynthesis protein